MLETSRDRGAGRVDINRRSVHEHVSAASCTDGGRRATTEAGWLTRSDEATGRSAGGIGHRSAR